MGGRVTFAEFNHRAERGAAMLESMGVVAGERVAILCHKCVAFFELLFACGKLGAILVPLNWRQTPAELAPILIDCGARLLSHDAATAPLAEALGRAQDLRPIPFSELEALIAAIPQAAPILPASHWRVLAPASPRDEAGCELRGARHTAWPTDRIWYLLYTSGTTGRPKAVIETVGMALANYVTRT